MPRVGRGYFPQAREPIDPLTSPSRQAGARAWSRHSHLGRRPGRRSARLCARSRTRRGALLDLETYYKDHWVEIEPERLERTTGFLRVDPERAAATLAPVGVQPGEVVLDFGSGPGFVSAELAKLAGPSGHVHGVDVNAEFVARARQVAAESGVAERCTFHHVLDERVPLADGSVDRAYAKNVLEYVPDVAHTLAELRRVLRPGGTLVASDSDWGFVVIEPLEPAEVIELFSAAAPAFREPFMGRRLRGAFRGAGFAEVSLNVVPTVDSKGALRPAIDNWLGYGTRFGRMSEARAAELSGRVDTALAEGDYLLVLPQFWVTGRR
ncbi:MAG: methyltransferase domain-containing protein [Acidimicrobiia bacterium]|nr:methyltransferase domain-containing protein [Acidimicrobiia bacterium]